MNCRVKIQTGVIIYLTVQRTAITSSSQVTEPEQRRQISPIEVRRLAVSIDHRGYFSIMQVYFDSHTLPLY
jgi:hypothetical protein